MNGLRFLKALERQQAEERLTEAVKIGMESLGEDETREIVSDTIEEYNVTREWDAIHCDTPGCPVCS